MESYRGDVLEIAKKLTEGDRNKDYGEPYQNLGQTAALWAAYTGYEFTPEMVANCMVLVKLARTANGPYKQDNYVDAAAYAAIAAECRHIDLSGRNDET